MVKAREVMAKMQGLDRKFRRSCNQIVLLNQRIKDKQARYDWALRAQQRSWRHSLRLQLASLEGLRNAFYEYAARRADELEVLQEALVEEGILSDTEEDLDWDEEN